LLNTFVHCSKKFKKFIVLYEIRIVRMYEFTMYFYLFLLISIYFCFLFQFTVRCFLNTTVCFLKIVHCSKKFSVSSFKFRVKKVQKCSLFNVNIMDKTNIPSRFFLLFHCWLPSMIACKHKFLLVLYVRLFYHPNLLADYLFRIF